MFTGDHHPFFGAKQMPFPTIRRHQTTLTALLVLAAGLSSTITAMTARTDAADALADMDVVRDRFLAELKDNLSAGFDPGPLMESLRDDGSWPGIDYEDVSRTGFEHSRHLRNMQNLSQAYNRPDFSYYQDPELAETILTALDFWIEHDFICDNWWWNEMGTPDRLLNTLLLMDAELTEEQRTEGARIAGRASFDGFGARPGGDMIKVAGIVGKRALFQNDVEGFEEAVAAMADEVRIGTGRGLQPDLSLQHRRDRVTSTLTYGYGYAVAFAEYAVKLKGTRFAFPGETLELLIDFYLDGIHKSMAHGRYRDPAQLNRGITRNSPQRPTSANVPRMLASVSSYRTDELEELIAVREGSREPAFTFNKFFWSSEYFTHHRPAYYASVRLYSSRNHNVEQPYNREGLRNHFLADGSNFMIRTGREYADVFVAYDWRKIPGTTVVQKPSFPPPDAIAQRGLTDFVGGVSDGVYGAAVFDFKSPHDSLEARKAWFFFDEEYVCLGAGIKSEEAHPVATTVNQVSLKGAATVGNPGGEVIEVSRGTHDLSNPRWVWHDGIGYVFPTSARVQLKQDVASGNQRDINEQSWVRDETVEREVFGLWIDHGEQPVAGDYAYIVVPGIDAGDIAAYEEKSRVSVVSNTPSIQAVAHPDLGQNQVVFHEPGEIEFPSGLTIVADQPGLVMIKETNGRIDRLTVADPARRHTELELRIGNRMEGADDGWEAVWDESRGHSHVRISLPRDDDAGKSKTIEPGAEH